MNTTNLNTLKTIKENYVNTGIIELVSDRFLLSTCYKFHTEPYSNFKCYHEPDFLEFIHLPTKIKCIVERMEHTGHLNGYIYLELNNFYKLYNKTSCKEEIKNDLFFYNEGSDFNPNVHGGITYNRVCEEDPTLRKIGFDTRHCDDLSPIDKNEYMFMDSERKYRNVFYVLHETISLAQQVHDFIEKQKATKQ